MSARLWLGPFDNVRLFSFSGIPGVGKSTAISELDDEDILQTHLEAKYRANGGKRKLKVVVVHEPSDLWRKMGYLQAFYEDPKANALSFQFIVFDTHVDAVQKAIYPYKDDKETLLVVLVERSMWDQLLFWKLQIDLARNKDDVLDDAAYMGVWQKWNMYLPPIRKIFYCYTSDLQKTMQRVARRARREELGISKSGQSIPNDLVSLRETNSPIQSAGGLSIEYMTALKNKHDVWYTEPLARVPAKDLTPSGQKEPIKLASVHCTHVDMDLPYHNDREQLEELAKLLAEEIIGFL